MCTDKTGTLTQNRMAVKAVYMAGTSQSGDTDYTLMQNKNLQILVESVVHNSSAFVQTEAGKQIPKGNVTEVGLIKYFLDSKISLDEFYFNKNQPGFFELAIPFSSARKRQTTAVRLQNGTVRVFVKGGPDLILESCSRQLNSKGEIIQLQEGDRSEITAVIKKFA